MFDEILEIKSYSLGQEEKEKLLFTERLAELTSHHRANCPEYKRILDAVSFDMNKVKSYTAPFFLTVSLFKERQPKSVSSVNVVKTMTSSGTTGQKVARFILTA